MPAHNNYVDGPLRPSNYVKEDITLNTCYNGEEIWVPGSLDWQDIVPSVLNDPLVLLDMGVAPMYMTDLIGYYEDTFIKGGEWSELINQEELIQKYYEESLQKCTVECYENEDCYYASGWIRLNDETDKWDYTAVLKTWLYRTDSQQTLYFYCSLHTSMSSGLVRKITKDTEGRWASYVEGFPDYLSIDGNMLYSHIWQKRSITNYYYCAPDLCPTSSVYEKALFGTELSIPIASDLLQKQPSGLSLVQDVTEIIYPYHEEAISLEDCQRSCLESDECVLAVTVKDGYHTTTGEQLYKCNHFRINYGEWEAFSQWRETYRISMAVQKEDNLFFFPSISNDTGMFLKLGLCDLPHNQTSTSTTTTRTPSVVMTTEDVGVRTTTTSMLVTKDINVTSTLTTDRISSSSTQDINESTMATTSTVKTTTPTVTTKDTNVTSALTTDRISSSSTQDINDSTMAVLTYPTDFPPVPPTQGLYTTDREETDATTSNETNTTGLTQDINNSTMATTHAVTTTVGNGCVDGMPSGGDLKWLHIQDGNPTVNPYGQISSKAIISTYSVFDLAFDTVYSSLAIAHDKPSVCDSLGLSCSCSSSFKTNSDLESLTNYLSIDTNPSSPLYTADNYLDIPARTSLFDPLIEFSSAFSGSLSHHDGKWDLHVVSIVTNGCARMSGRDDNDYGEVSQKWELVPKVQQDDWMYEDSGIDKYSGAVTQDKCNLRDYPTIDELALNLRSSSTGVVVIVVGDSNDLCKDFGGTVREYWTMVESVMSEYEVPFTYSIARDNELGSVLESELSDLIGSVCPIEPTNTTGLTQDINDSTMATTSTVKTTTPTVTTTTPTVATTTSTVTTTTPTVKTTTSTVTTTTPTVKTTTPTVKTTTSTVTTTTPTVKTTTPTVKTTTPTVTTKDTTASSTLTTDRISSSSTQDIGDSTTSTECPPGYYKPTLQIEWTHVLDTAGSMESYKDVIAEALSLVSIDLKKFVGSDNATFSLIETADKTRACTAQDVASCECHGELFREERFRQLNCAKDGSCALWDAALDRAQWVPEKRSRSSVFDSVMDVSNEKFDKKSSSYRLITATTDGCSRISGRSSQYPTIQDKYWNWIPREQKRTWMTEPGISERTGRLLEGNCNIRDYPTIPELAMNLKASSTRLVVLGVEEDDKDCQDVRTDTVQSFWENTVKLEMENLYVDYSYHRFEDAFTLATAISDIIRGIEVECIPFHSFVDMEFGQ